MADFAFGFALTALSHLLVGAWRLASRLTGPLVAVVRRRPSSSCERTMDLARDSRAVVPLAPQPEPRAEFTPLAEKPSVRFDDIAGLEDAKREIRLRMILPLLHPEKARLYGVRQGGGILLYGPPGTGKTMLAKAIATEVDAAFYCVRPSDILRAQFVGGAEANLDRLFRTLRQEKRAVLFMDEAEALAPDRRKNGSTIMQRLISQLLGEVDGLAIAPAGHTLLLVGATNMFEIIDPAMLRPGRFDAKIYVGLPDHAARKQILEANLRGRLISADVDLDSLAERTEGLSGAEIRHVVDRAADVAFLVSLGANNEIRPISMRDFLVTPGPNEDTASTRAPVARSFASEATAVLL